MNYIKSLCYYIIIGAINGKAKLNEKMIKHSEKLIKKSHLAMEPLTS